MKKALRYVLALALVSSLVSTAEAQKKKSASKKTTTQAAAPVQQETPPPPVEVDPFQPATFEVTPGFNPHSVRPIHESHIMHKRGVWRRINLMHKPNTPFFASQNEITKLIIDAVKDGRLTPYKNDSLAFTMSKEEFVKRITDPTQGPVEITQEMREFMTPEEIAELQNRKASEYTPQQLYLLDLKEDLIFDKQRSRVVYDIQTITLILPAHLDPQARGVENVIASFRFKDLVKVFDENPNAKWYNLYNRAQDKRLSDAFELRLFHSHIIKMSDPQNRSLADIYTLGGANSGLIAAQRKEHAIVEWENDLWDY